MDTSVSPEQTYLRQLVSAGHDDTYRSELSQLHSDGFIDEAEFQRRSSLLNKTLRGRPHSHGRDCCWECFHGPDSHPHAPGCDQACDYENCPPDLAGQA